MGRTASLRVALAAASVVSLGAIAACSSSGGPNEAPDAQATIGCQSEGETYSADMVKTGKTGKYTFSLVLAAPAPPGLDGNVWTMKVVDANGQSPPASQLSAVPYMPQMGHGTGQVPSFAANPDGTFTVADVYLFMDGLWTVTFDVTAPASGGGKPTVLDTVVYTFCING